LIENFTMIKILIGGDICPTKADLSSFTGNKPQAIFNDLLTEIQLSDLSIINLETPLITRPTPIEKSGAVFGSPVGAIGTMKEARVNLINLSNNHILDHGPPGLNSTIGTIQKANIDFTGAGRNLNDASKPFIKQINGIRLGILSYCEHEFSVAKQDSPGANPLDLIDFHHRIDELNNQTDIRILLYHGGKENYRIPSPEQQKLLRYFISKGINIVVCQHSHTPGYIEEIPGKGNIFYGQGNFVFDPAPLKKKWLYEGFLIQLEVKKGGAYNYKLIPYIHKSWNREGIGIRKLQEKDANIFIKELMDYSTQITNNPEIITEEWRLLCERSKDSYLSVLRGNNRFFRKLNKTIPFLRFIYKKKKARTLQNLVSCETHVEILRTILENS